MANLTAGSLFSGIGGIDVAFAAAGFDIRFQVEIDGFCRKVLAKHAPRYWPNATQHVDIRDVGRAELGSVDVLFGGFPCQDISVAGNGAGLEGARSGLWYEFRRIIGDIRPRVVFIENVPAITSRGGTTVIAHLTALGYDARWGIVGAADAGAPHGRRRWFCVAYASSVRYAKPTAAAGSAYQGVGDGEARQQTGQYEQRPTVSNNEILDYSASTRCSERPRISGLSGESVSQAERADVSRERNGAKLAQPRICRDADGLSRWMVRPKWPAGSGQPQYAYEPARQLSVKSQDWSARIHALGNAVVPQVVYPFAVEIARIIAAD